MEPRSGPGEEDKLTLLRKEEGGRTAQRMGEEGGQGSPVPDQISMFAGALSWTLHCLSFTVPLLSTQPERAETGGGR